YNPYRRTVVSASGTETFNFVRLIPGDNFTVDVSSGLVYFINVFPRPEDNIVVAYTLVSGSGAQTRVGYDAAGQVDFTPANLDSDFATGKTSAAKHLIQYGSRYSSVFDSHMSFQFYNLGNRDILNPQLDPDFRLI